MSWLHSRIVIKCLSLLFAALPCGLAMAVDADWPQFLGPTRNGVYAGADLSKTWPKDGPTVVWKKKIGAGFAGPAVAGGKLILFHRVGDQETVDCLDAKAGTPIWSMSYPTRYVDDFGFDEGPRATPSIVDGKVYTFGAEGSLHCWESATGKQVWAVETRDKFAAGKGYFGMVCSPLVEGDAVVANVGGNGAGIVAFNKNTGDVLWKATDDEAGYSSPIAVTINSKRYILSLTRSNLVALEPASGKVIFSYEMHAPIQASVNAATPIVVDDLIFVSASYGTGAALLKFNEAGPEKVWAADDVLSNHYATSVYRDGYLYGFDGRQEQGCNLRCVEFKTGKVAWSEDRFGAGTVILAGEKLVILTEKGQLLIAPASPKGFKPDGKAQVLPFGCRAYPAMAGGMFYARSKDTLICLDLRGK